MKTVINQILENLILISLDCNLWSGEKKLRPEDLGGVILPPDKLASLGSKRIFDPASLRIFKTLKRRAERTLIDVGVRFLGGYAIPDVKLQEVFDALAEIENEFLQAKTDFLSEYDSKLNSWLIEAGEWQDIVRRAIEPASSVADKIDFGFTAIRVGSPEASSAAVQQTLEKKVGGLSAQLMREIAQSAKETLEETYNGRTEVTRKALSPLNAIREKLEGLMFINPAEIGGLVNNVKAAIAAVPKSGPITGAVLMGLVGALNQMAGINGFVAAAQKVQEEDPFADAQPADVPAAPAKKTKKKEKPTVAPKQVPAAAAVEEETEVEEIQVIPEPEQAPDAWFW